jgi:hypothetical protein
MWAHNTTPNGIFDGTNFGPQGTAQEKHLWENIVVIANKMIDLLKENDKSITLPLTGNQQMCL